MKVIIERYKKVQRELEEHCAQTERDEVWRDRLKHLHFMRDSLSRVLTPVLIKELENYWS